MRFVCEHGVASMRHIVCRLLAVPAIVDNAGGLKNTGRQHERLAARNRNKLSAERLEQRERL